MNLLRQQQQQWAAWWSLPAQRGTVAVALAPLAAGEFLCTFCKLYIEASPAAPEDRSAGTKKLAKDLPPSLPT